MSQKRRQLTLFIDPKQSANIESIRQIFNPEQYALISAHVTLCREDELEPIDNVINRLENCVFHAVTIEFDAIVRFSDGKGVLIPAKENNLPFQQLREKILEGLVEKPRKHEPHITLLHPRNATCTDNVFEKIQKSSFPKQIEFGKISLIEQEFGQKWSVLREFDLTQIK